MCGIAGYFVTKPGRIRPAALQSLAKGLLLGIEERGRDATGYAYVSRRDKFVRLAKAPVPATEFVGIEGHLLSQEKIHAMPRSMLLHTRYATQGVPSDNRNNHPVYSKQTGLCLIHNGWLVNEDALLDTFKLKKDAEVDTETYLRTIEKFYLEADPKTVEAGIQYATKVSWGSFACAMVQGGRQGVMWLWRETGPVVLGQVDWGWIFASTPRAIMNAVYGSDVKAIDISFVKLGELKEKTLLRFSGDGSVMEYKLSPRDWSQLPTEFSHRVSKIWDTEKQTWTVRRNRGTASGFFYGDYDEWGYGDYGYYRGTGTNGVHNKDSAAGNTESKVIGLPSVVDARTGAADTGTTTGANRSGNEEQEQAKKEAEVDRGSAGSVIVDGEIVAGEFTEEAYQEEKGSGGDAVDMIVMPTSETTH